MPSAHAIILEQPERLSVRPVDLSEPGAEDVVVDIEWTGVSTGTERLLFTGRMPHFPGMGYPLVPGYEAVGRIAMGPRSGEAVFVPGASCFGELRGLFGAAASRLVVPSTRAVTIDPSLEEKGTLLALAATAHHALSASDAVAPALIAGHGVLGRLLARLTVALGFPAPTVWEPDAHRRTGADGYAVIDPREDDRWDYPSIYDMSGQAGILDELLPRLARGGSVVLAGFYADPVSFAFPPAFIREARIRIAAEWAPADLQAVQAMLADGRLSLDGLITHRRAVGEAQEAYAEAFAGGDCLKMILNWGARA